MLHKKLASRYVWWSKLFQNESNNNNNNNNGDDNRILVVKAIIQSATVSVASLGIIGNILTLLTAVRMSENMNNSGTAFIKYLAVADCMALFPRVFTGMERLLDLHIRNANDFACKFNAMFSSVSYYTGKNNNQSSTYHRFLFKVITTYHWPIVNMADRCYTLKSPLKFGSKNTRDDQNERNRWKEMQELSKIWAEKLQGISGIKMPKNEQNLSGIKNATAPDICQANFRISEEQKLYIDCYSTLYST